MTLLLSPPNQLTVLRILLTPVFVAMFLSNNPQQRLWSVVIFVVAMLTDWYDGYVARRWGYVTRWGSYLDPFADKILISAALFTFVVMDLVPAWTVWTIVIRDVGITFLRSYSELKGKPFDTSHMAKSKTFLQFVVVHYVLLLFVLSSSVELSPESRGWVDALLARSVVDPLMAITTLFTVVTGVMYLINNRDTLRQLHG